MKPHSTAAWAAIVLAGAMALPSTAIRTARAEETITLERLHRMLKKQQEELVRQRSVIRRQAEQIRQLRRDLDDARRDTRRGRKLAVARPAAGVSSPARRANPPSLAPTPPGSQPIAAPSPAGPPPGNPRKSNGRDRRAGRVFGEFLYLKPVSNQYQIAFNDPSSNAVGAPGPGSTLSRIDPDFSVGFRVGLGLDVPYTNVDARVAFTYAASTAASTFSARPGGAVRPLVFSGSATAASAAATGRAAYDLTVYAVDGEIGHRMAIGSTGAVRLFGGIRFLNVDHDIHARFLGGSLGTQQAIFLNRSSYLGGGPRLGARLDLDLPWGFFLTGTAAGSFLFGRMKIDHEEVVAGVPQGDFTFNNTTPFVLGVEAILGAGWRGNLLESTRLEVVLGYQFWHWSNVSATASFADAANSAGTVIRREDLSMHGPYLRAKLTFQNLGDLLSYPFGVLH